MGAVWAGFDLGATVAREPYSGFCPTGFPMQTYPIAYSLPPPDGLWYPCDSSQYGPTVRTLQAGWINSVPDSADFNPCLHSSFDGCLTYLGDNSAFGPSWRRGAANTGASPNNLTLSGWYSQFGVPLRWQLGKSCLAANPGMYDRNGVLQSVNLSTPLQYYYYGGRSTSAATVMGSVASTAPAGSDCLGPGAWFVKCIRGGYPVTYHDEALFHYYTIQRPTPNQIAIDWYVEFHTDASYVSSNRVSPYEVSTGYGYLLQASHRKMLYTITHIRSTAKAVFQIMLTRTDINEWYGWQPWQEYQGTDTKTTKVIQYLATMSPGLVCAAPTEFSAKGLNEYAKSAPSVCDKVYSKGYAKIARTRCISDVDGLDSNWIENISQAGSALAVVQPLIEGYTAVKTGNVAMARKALAGAYLAWSYNVRPALADAVNIQEDGTRVFNLATSNRFANERRRGQYKRIGLLSGYDATQVYSCTMHFELKDNPFAQIWNALERLGLDPSLDNLWDLVPFSFVIDWFISIGSALTSVSDYLSSVFTKDLKARIESYKVSWLMPTPEVCKCLGLDVSQYGESGMRLTYKWYRRSVSRTIGSFDPFSGQSNDGLSASQWAQGVALSTSFT